MNYTIFLLNRLFAMKKVLISIILIIGLYSMSFAQTDRGSIGLVRLNGTANFYNSIKIGDKYSQNGTLGFSLDFGAKQFLGQSNLFLEETTGFVYSKMPSLMSMHFDPYPGWESPYVFLQKGREAGVSASLILGYQFPVKNNLSIDVFAGPEFRYLFKYKCLYDNRPNLHKANLRLKAGANLNINSLNISLFASPDLLDRGKGVGRYRTVQVGIGVGYYFKWKNVWKYLSTEH
ncbi:MAG: hypothetical protein IJG54_06800 [Bacteroidales bacterium]|nr:hypothetical protein [Bacteroidales bacterium]